MVIHISIVPHASFSSGNLSRRRSLINARHARDEQFVTSWNSAALICSARFKGRRERFGNVDLPPQSHRRFPNKHLIVIS